MYIFACILSNCTVIVGSRRLQILWRETEWDQIGIVCTVQTVMERKLNLSGRICRTRDDRSLKITMFGSNHGKSMTVAECGWMASLTGEEVWNYTNGQ